MGELAVLEWLQGAAPALDGLMEAVSLLATYSAVWLILAFVLTCTKDYRRAGVAIIVSVAAAYIVSDLILKPLVDRARPYEVADFELIVAAATTSSFPSGHVASSFAAATALFIYNKKAGAAAAAFACLVGVSRMYLYLHWPTDVLAGAIIGIAVAVLCVWFMSRYIPYYRSLPNPRGGDR